jgi:hypothetical protein
VNPVEIGAWSDFVAHQCEGAIAHFRTVRSMVAARNALDDAEGLDHYDRLAEADSRDRAESQHIRFDVFHHIQAGLACAGNVSKAFWSSKKSSAVRCRELRDCFQVAENDEVLHARDLRNAYEHMDERIDRWIAEAPPTTHADRLVLPLDDLPPLMARNAFRTFDPATGIATMSGTSPRNIYQLETRLGEIRSRIST